MELHGDSQQDHGQIEGIIAKIPDHDHGLYLFRGIVFISVHLDILDCIIRQHKVRGCKKYVYNPQRYDNTYLPLRIGHFCYDTVLFFHLSICPHNDFLRICNSSASRLIHITNPCTKPRKVPHDILVAPSDIS